MSSEFEDARARHGELFRAASGDIGEEFAAAVEAASIFDLQWFLGRIDEQLEETPHHVTEPEALQPMLERMRRRQMIVASALDTKMAIQEKNEKSEVRLWKAVAFFGMVLGIIVGVLVAIYF